MHIFPVLITYNKFILNMKFSSEELTIKNGLNKLHENLKIEKKNTKMGS